MILILKLEAKKIFYLIQLSNFWGLPDEQRYPITAKIRFIPADFLICFTLVNGIKLIGDGETQENEQSQLRDADGNEVSQKMQRYQKKDAKVSEKDAKVSKKDVKVSEKRWSRKGRKNSIISY